MNTITREWVVTTDRDGTRTHVLPDGTYVQHDGSGRMAWTVHYAEGDYGMTDTLRLAKEWGEV